MSTDKIPYVDEQGRIACRVKTFAQRHSFGPYPPGSILYIDAKELKHPSVAAALVTLEKEDADKRAAAERLKAQESERVEMFEQERASTIAAMRATKEAEEARFRASAPGPVTAPTSRPFDSVSVAPQQASVVPVSLGTAPPPAPVAPKKGSKSSAEGKE